MASRTFNNAFTAFSNACKNPSAAIATLGSQDPLSTHINWISGVLVSSFRSTKAHLQSPAGLADSVIGREIVFYSVGATAAVATVGTAGTAAPVTAPIAVAAAVWKEIVKAHAPLIRVVFSPSNSETSAKLLEMFYSFREDNLQKPCASELNAMLKSKALVNVSQIFNLRHVVSEQGTVVDAKAQGLRFYVMSWGPGAGNASIDDIGDLQNIKWPKVGPTVKGFVDWNCVVLAVVYTPGNSSRSRRQSLSLSARQCDS